MEDPLSVLITGDFYAGGRTEEIIRENQYSELFNEFLPFIRKSDVAITNLESPITEGVKSIPKTGPSLKAIPKTIELLKFAGFNIVSLANNHIMDYGEDGLNDTISLLNKNGIGYLGAGANLREANKPIYYTKNNLKIGLLNFTENEWSTTIHDNPGANPIDPISNFDSIRDAKNNSDKVIIIAHGGHEMYNLPSPRMKQLFRFYVDAGADVVINHHTHCVSGYEVYKKSPIFYSLGNFLFDNERYKNTIWNRGIALQLILNKVNTEFNIIHFNQSDEMTGVVLCNDGEIDIRNSELDKLNHIIANDKKLNSSFEEFVLKQKKNYKSYIEPHKNKYLQYLQNRNLLPSLWTKRKKQYLLNLVRCEAHRDILIKTLLKDVSDT